MTTVTKLCIQELEDHVLKKGVTEWNIMAKDLRLGSLGLNTVASGMTRQVFKYPHSRFVFKIGEPISNRAEYVMSQGLEGTRIGNLLAKSYGISKKGTVLCQEYVRVPLSNSCAPSSLEWVGIRDSLENLFDLGILGKIRDLHPGNIHITPTYDLKIIDYAYGLKPTVTEKNCEALIRKVRKASKIIDKEVSFYLSDDDHVVLYNGAVTTKVLAETIHQKNWLNKIL